MMKRFTETTKWQDRWFMSLSPNHKLAWLYILDTCDHAGVWEVNPMLVSFMVGVQMDISDMENVFAGRFHWIGDDKWWIPKFIHHQYGKTLNYSSRIHQSVLKRLDSLSIDYAKGMLTLKDKDKDKDILDLKVWLEYAREIGWNTTDAENAFDHYQANGWRQSNGNKIKDWRAAARQCQRRVKTTQQANGGQDTTWSIKTRLEAVSERIEQLRSKSPGVHCDLYDFLTEDEREEWQKLHKNKKQLETKLRNL